MSKEDLIPQNRRTEAERKRLAIVGGKASGAARRQKRDLKTHLLALLEAKDDSGMSGSEKIALGLFKKAAKGDSKAVELLFTLAGQAPRVTVDLPEMPTVKSPKDAPLLTNVILKAASSGKISVAEAGKLADIAATHTKSLESAELEERIVRLEEQNK